jgi:hypothetical protein
MTQRKAWFLESLFKNKSFGARMERIERKSSPKGGIMIAQHVAEGGVLGEVGSRSESPGDDTGSHTDSRAWMKKNFLDDCRIPAWPFDYIVKAGQPPRPKTVTG